MCVHLTTTSMYHFFHQICIFHPFSILIRSRCLLSVIVITQNNAQIMVGANMYKLGKKTTWDHLNKETGSVDNIKHSQAQTIILRYEFDNWRWLFSVDMSLLFLHSHILTKKYRLQEQPKSFVLVHFSAWASLENNVNKRTLATPVIYTFCNKR